MIKKAPIRFVPYLKSVIWGGDKICVYKGIAQDEPRVGESWEISQVPGHVSVVAEGGYAGMSLTELIDCFGEELLGSKVLKRYDGKFPLLIKLIDASADLSVQVHPDDALAMQRHGSLGKTEMWYIIDADKGAKIYSGLNREITPEEYVAMVRDGSIEDVLAAHDSEPGDVFFLPAGRVHAIGAGNLLAEIQESSDITYRIYDYNRVDADGNPRQLHTEEAKDAIDYTCHSDYKSAPANPSAADATLVDCSHFKVDRLLVDGEMKPNVSSDSFTVLMCIEGKVSVECDDGTMEMKQGETALIPAAASRFMLKGTATLLSAQSAV